MIEALFGDRFLGGSVQGAILAVPVRWGEETVGVLAYERGVRPSERFSADDRTRLAAVAILCAEEIDRSQPLAPAAM